MVLEDACLWRHEIQNAYVVDLYLLYDDVVVEQEELLLLTTTT